MLRRAGHSAFTLLELILVLVVIVIVMAMAAPQLVGWSHGSKLRDSAEEFVAMARYCRAQAVSDARTYRLAVDANNGTYQLTVQNGTSFTSPASSFGRVFAIAEGCRMTLTDPNGTPVQSIDSMGSSIACDAISEISPKCDRKMDSLAPGCMASRA